MSLSFDDLTIQHQLWVGAGVMPVFGVGPAKIRGAVYVEGPEMVGAPHPFVSGCMMVGPLINPDAPIPFIPGGFCYGLPSNPFSLSVVGSTAVIGNLETSGDVTVGGNLKVQGLVLGSCGNWSKFSRISTQQFNHFFHIFYFLRMFITNINRTSFRTSYITMTSFRNNISIFIN
jgi:hypothetical protein